MVGQVARPPSTWEVVWQSPWKHEAYLVCVLGLAYALNDYALAVASTSYCHYVMYIWTYYHRGVGATEGGRARLCCFSTRRASCSNSAPPPLQQVFERGRKGPYESGPASHGVCR